METFWGLTGTGWTAIGSIVGAVSIIVLAVLNRLALNAAQQAAQAASAQAEVANKSLSLLQDQSQQQDAAQKEQAVEVLEQVARTTDEWKGRLSGEHFDVVQLFPTN